jgi:serine/threonine protein kinase/tetratricopeptide (TPR) repeat protein
MPDLLERIRSALADRYAVESEIGRGGMAVVFLAEDLKHHRQVAIKVLHPELAAAVGPDRFLREIEAVAGLTHPHVVPLHDSGEADGLLFYVMPYVEEESLRHRLDRERQLPVDEAVRITRDVAEALDHAHRHGLIHRDIKPGNILLEEGHAVVTDFGVARALSEVGEDKVTATGMSVGTPAYMSPEQASGGEVDERSDLYALGCVLYEMLAGEPPLVGSTPQSTAAKRLMDRPTPLPVLRGTVAPELSACVDRLLAKLPADRFDSAAAMREALSRFGSDAQASSVVVHGSPMPGPRRDRWTRRIGLSLAGLAVVAIAAWQLIPRMVTSSADSASSGVAVEPEARPSIAVLPLANRSEREEDAFFTEAFHDELLTRLAMIGGMKVISRTSVLGYGETPTKSLRSIGEELGARYVVEGGVFRIDDHVRVNLQLIDAPEDAHLWARTFDVEMAVENLISVQEEVARQVVAAVQAEVRPAELAAIATAPTLEREAYELYLRGRLNYSRSYDSADYVMAEELFRRAIEIDSTFALAWSFLASTAARSYFLHHARTEEKARLAWAAARRALELEPDLPQAHFAMGEYYYHVPIDLGRALHEYLTAHRDAPNDDEITAAIGFVKRRQGDWWSARAYLQEALEYNPLSGNQLTDLAETEAGLRLYPEAERTFMRAIELVPERADAYTYLSGIYLSWTGESTKAREVLREAHDRVPPSSHPALIRANLRVELLDRDYPAALSLLQTGPEILESQFVFRTRTLLAAEVHSLAGDTAAARVHFDSARVLLERRLLGYPDDHRLHDALGLALAGLGDHAEAIAAVQRSLEIMPLQREAWKGLFGHETLARVYALAGDRDSAMDELETIVSRPALLGTLPLRLDPFWDPLRGDPRFEALVRASESPLVQPTRSAIPSDLS